METIKVLAINTSPRKGRNTEQLLEEVLAGCRSVENGEGDSKCETGLTVETELVRVSDAKPEDFKLCRGCWACSKTGKCVCGDDFIKELYGKIADADVVIFGSPVFFYSVTAQCKAIMDRGLAYMPMGTGKVSAAAITCGSAGVASALGTVQGFCICNNFTDAGWVATYGKTKDKEKGKDVARKLGRKAVRLAAVLKKTVAEAEAAGDSELVEDLAHSNHFAYGTHTF